MLGWFKKGREEKLPGFWKEYTGKFLEKLPEDINEVRFVVLDTETTGFDYKEDRILSIGAIAIINNCIDINSGFEVYIHQEKINPKSIEIHGLFENDNHFKVTEEDAIKEFLPYLQNSVIVAHHAHFDITMINQALNRLGLPKLKNKILDTGVLYKATRISTNLIDRDKNYTLDELANTLSISLQDRHTASGDAYITAIAFMKLVSKLKKSKNLKLANLFRL